MREPEKPEGDLQSSSLDKVYPKKSEDSSQNTDKPKPNSDPCPSRRSGRIPDEVVERIKREVSVADLVREYGVKLAGNGANLIGLCPFHADHNPSLVITPSKNLWHCLGACQMGGSNIDWVMKTRGLGVREAIEYLGERYGYWPVGEMERPGFEAEGSKNPLPALCLGEEDRVLMERVVAYYQQCFQRTPAAQAYLEKRGITKGAIEHFKIGFAGRTLCKALGSGCAGRKMRERLIGLGIFRESGHEHFNGSVVIPIWDEAGAVVGMYGRKIGAKLHAGTPLHLYLPGPHRGIWNRECLTSKEVILCKAIFDGMSFWGQGLRNVTAAYGVNGFTEEIQEAFAAHGVERVYLAFDPDEAGEKELAQWFAESGIAAYQVLFPRRLDANAFVSAMGEKARAELNALLEAAAPFVEGNRVTATTHSRAFFSSLVADSLAAKKENETTEALPASPEPQPSLPLAGEEAAKEKKWDMDLPWRQKGADIANVPVPQPAVFVGMEGNGEISLARRVELMSRLRDFFHGRISESNAAKAFLRERGLYSPELVSYFKLGYDDGRVNQTITAEEIGDLRQLGLINDKNHSRFYQCLTVGIEDADGNVIGLYGRRVNSSKGSKHQLPQGGLAGILNVKAFRASRELIITEGPLDMYSVCVMGLWNVSCIFSASSIPPLLAALLVQSPIERVHLLLDNDPPGENACALFVQAINGRSITRPRFPDGVKDANELLLRWGREKASAYLRKMIAEAEPVAQPCSIFPFSGPPAAPTPVNPLDIPVTVASEEITLLIEDRRYRVRGFDKNLSFDSLRVNLAVFAADRYHIDTLELYNAGRRLAFARCAAQELGVDFEVLKRDLGRILLKLERIQAREIGKALEPKTREVALSEREREDAMRLLRDPKLMERIAGDFKTCGLVGEENCQMTYLTYTSCLLDDPLAVLIQALSGAGKTALMDAGLEFMPSERVVRYTGVSGQSLYYFGEEELAHKILAISEDQGAEDACYPLKILQSEKELRKVSTVKDPKSGRFSALEYRVEGPAAIALCTTREVVDEELLSRFLVLTSNQGREQTREIHRRQREKDTLEDLIEERERERIRKLHQNAQRLLRPLKVVNPYARYLTFPDTQLRTRRDHLKYLTLIRTIAFLHQYQREVKKRTHQGETIEYIEVPLDDIAIANRLVSHVLGASLDELAPQTRRLLGIIGQMADDFCGKKHLEQSKYRFTRREVRERTGWHNNEIKRHLDQLVDFEYLAIQKGSWGRQYVYELLYKGEGEDGRRFLPGLVDVEKLRNELEGGVR